MSAAASEAHTPQIRGGRPRPGLNRFYIGGAAPREGLKVAPRRAARPSVRNHQEPSTRAGRWGQGVDADTPPAVPPAPGRGRNPAGPRPAARPAGSLAQARCRGRRIRAALPLARPASFLPAEPRASRAWPPAAETAAALPLPPHPAPCPEVLPGWGPSGVIARPRRRRGRPPASRPSRPSQPVAAGAFGAWNAGSPRGPRSSVRGSPREPTRRPKIEPRWRRSEAELCRGRAGYIVSSPRLPPAPLPPAFLPSPTRAARPSPCLCLAVPPPPPFAPLPLYTAPPGDPCAPPLPAGRMDCPAGR